MRNIFNLVAVLVFSVVSAQDQHVIDSLNRILLTTKIDSVRADVMNEIAWTLFRSDLDTSITLSLSALKIAEKCNAKEEIADANNNLGVFYSERGNYTLALSCHTRALNIRTELGKDKAMAMSMGNIGSVYEDQGNSALALEYYLKALRVDSAIKNSKGVARHLNNIGLLYRSIGEYQKSLYYSNRALKTYSELKDSIGIAKCYSAIGSVYRNLGDYDSSMLFTQYSLAMNLAMGNQASLAINYTNLGNIICSNADTVGESSDSLYRIGLQYYVEAVHISEALGIKKTIANAKGSIGRVYTRLGDFANAKLYLSEAFAIDSAMSDTAGMSNRYKAFADLYESTGNWQRAYQNYKLYSKLREHLMNREKSKAIGKVEAKAEFDKEQAILEAQHQQEMEKTAAEADAEQSKQRMIIVIVAAVAVIVALLALFIFVSLKTARKQKSVIEEQKHLVEEKNKEILDSITYARRLQEAILPPMKLWQDVLPESFVLYKPKDIVAGDFYFLELFDKHVIFAAADCTGHGVPGAMVSVVCSNALTRAVKEFKLTDPGKILDLVRMLVLETFERSESEVRDGMDISLCSLNTQTGELLFAGANRPLWLFSSGNEVPEEISGTKQPIGTVESPEPFVTRTLRLNKGDVVYIFTDGFADQFGGEKGKKFKTSNFKKLLSEIAATPIRAQGSLLKEAHDVWKGHYEQVDDICIIGLRI